MPRAPIDEPLNFTDPEPMIPTTLFAQVYCKSLYREICLLYHSLPENMKEKWHRPRIRATTHDLLIRAYQDLRQRLIEDVGVLPVDYECTTLPPVLSQEASPANN